MGDRIPKSVRPSLTIKCYELNHRHGQWTWQVQDAIEPDLLREHHERKVSSRQQQSRKLLVNTPAAGISHKIKLQTISKLNKKNNGLVTTAINLLLSYPSL